jgi:hypothetical protein
MLSLFRFRSEIPGQESLTPRNVARGGRKCALGSNSAWNHLREGRLARGADGGTIAMRIKYLAAIAIAASAASIGLAVHSFGSLPPAKQSTPATAQVATVLAESLDPFLHRSGG